MATSDGVRDYFTWLQQMIKSGAVDGEDKLRSTVEISLLPVAGTEGLLAALGYSSGMVKQQCPVQAGGRKVYADFLVSTGDSAWVLELKKPKIQLPDDAAVRQLLDYMARLDAPLGVLFNGWQALAFANHAHLPPSLRNSRTGREDTAIYETKAHSVPALSRLFAHLRQSPNLDTKALARKWARNPNIPPSPVEIDDTIKSALNSPTKAIASALINSVPKLKALGATADDVLKAWPCHCQTPTCPSTPKNPEVRRLVAAVCAKHGYETLRAQCPQGLRLKVCVAGHGYQRVPSGKGVPQGLCVQGVDGPTADRLIAELSKLRKAPKDGLTGN